MEQVIRGTSVSVIKSILDLFSKKLLENKDAENQKLALNASDLSLIIILKEAFPGLITIFDNKKDFDIKDCCYKTLEEEISVISSLLDQITESSK